MAKNKAKKTPKQEKRYQDYGTILCVKGGENEESSSERLKIEGALTIQRAKELLGWITEEEAIAQLGDAGKFENDFLLKDFEGNKVRMINNLTNRPIRPALWKRYREEFLSQEFAYNGETIILDWYGGVQDGQHRLIGFIMAEQVRAFDPEKYGKKALTWETSINVGIDPEVADTIGLGQSRTIADVIYRRDTFKGKDQKQAKKYSTILQKAVRLLWVRSSGKSLASSPYLHNRTACELIDQHPKLQEALNFIVQCDDEKQISSLINLGDAVCLLYLAGTSSSSREDYDQQGSKSLNFDNWVRACTFWEQFSNGDADYKEESSLHPLRTFLAGLKGKKDTGSERDDVISVLINAYNLWNEGKKLTSGNKSNLKVKRTKVDGVLKVTKPPRLGGIDSISEKKVDTPPSSKPKEKPLQDTFVPEKSDPDQWQLTDCAWVVDEDGEHWKGKITTISDDGKEIYLVDENGDEYATSIENLQLEEPVTAKAA